MDLAWIQGDRALHTVAAQQVLQKNDSHPRCLGILIAAVVVAGASAGCELLSLDGLTGDAGELDAAPGVVAPDASSVPDATTTADAADASFIVYSVEAGEESSLDTMGAPPDSAPPPRGGSDASSTSCGPDGGWLTCDGGCFDPSDPASCGGCGNVCATGACGATLSQSLAAMPTDWSFNGNASYNSSAPSAELTPLANYQIGTFIYSHPIVVDSFDVTFQLRLGLDGGSRSDGIGFMIEQTGPTAVGGVGEGLGMAALKGFGVEFDIFDNDVCGDTNDDHVGIDDLETCDAGGAPASIFATSVLGVDLGDAHWHAAEVTLAQGAVSVRVDGTLVAAGVALPGFQAGAQYFLGFAGATGGLAGPDGGPGGYRQEVKDIVVTFPTPHCL